jgi:hypothetical protein
MNEIEGDSSTAAPVAGQGKIERQGWPVLVGGLAGILVIFGLVWLTLTQRQLLAAERQATLSRRLAAQALDHLPDRLALALLLSAAASQTADTFEARDSLLTALQTSPHLETYLQGHQDWVWDVAALVNRAASTGLNNAKTSPQPLGPPLTGHTGFITAVAFSPDGRLLASSSDDRSLLLWKAQTGQSLGPLLQNYPHPLSNLAISPAYLPRRAPTLRYRNPSCYANSGCHAALTGRYSNQPTRRRCAYYRGVRLCAEFYSNQ